MRRFIAFVVVLLLLVGVGGGLAWFQFKVKPEMVRGFIAKAAPPPSAVAVSTADMRKWQTHIQAIGSFKAYSGVDIAPQIGGVVTSIHFDSGQDVKKGDLLVEINDATDQADLQSGTAALKNAELALQRQQQLVRGGNTPKANVDQAQAARDQAAAAVEHTRALIAQKHIVAPFSGRLGLRTVDLGQYVSPGTSMVTLQQLDPIYVDFPVPEQQVGLLAPKQTVDVRVDAFPGAHFTGHIASIDARVNAQTRTLSVRAEIANPDKKLLPGMFANVSVLAGEPREEVTVPRTAVTYSLYGDSVYVVKPAPAAAGTAEAATTDEPMVVERRFVRTGDIQGDRVAIVQGLKAGEKVVIEGQIKLNAGAKVRIDPNATLAPQNPLPKE